MRAPVSQPPRKEPDPAPAPYRIRVVDTRRRPIAGAEVRLSGADADPQELRYDAASTLYTGHIRERGTFVATVSAKGMESQERTVRVNHSGAVEEFVLGEKGLPYYYRGRVRTPFEPKDELIAVTLREAEKDAAPQVQRLAAELRLSEERTHEQVRRNHVRVFRLPGQMTASARRRAFDRLRAAPAVQLAGPVVEMFDERLVYLTNQFIVRFTPGVTRERADAIAGEHGFRTVRPVRAAGNAFLLEGEPRHDYRLLDAANALAERDEVEYAEPNAVTTSMVYAVTPPDFLVALQWHLPVVRLPDAWQSLRNSNPGGVMPGTPGDLTFGHEDIQVVVFDQGVQSVTTGGITTAAHPDFQGTVTSGAFKVSAFYDAVNVVPNNDVTAGDHGMGCTGVVAALANNASTVAGETEGVAGAAGNCRIIAIRAPFGQPNLRWADAFVWMAGMDPGWTADGVTYPLGATFPPLLARGAAIHTNSVRVPDVGLMDDALDFLATYGRGGRGMVSFFAAGNTPAPISNPRQQHDRGPSEGPGHRRVHQHRRSRRLQLHRPGHLRLRAQQRRRGADGRGNAGKGDRRHRGRRQPGGENGRAAQLPQQLRGHLVGDAARGRGGGADAVHQPRPELDPGARPAAWHGRQDRCGEHGPGGEVDAGWHEQPGLQPVVRVRPGGCGGGRGGRPRPGAGQRRGDPRQPGRHRRSAIGGVARRQPGHLGAQDERPHPAGAPVLLAPPARERHPRPGQLRVPARKERGDGACQRGVPPGPDRPLSGLRVPLSGGVAAQHATQLAAPLAPGARQLPHRRGAGRRAGPRGGGHRQDPLG
jgi:hypothetical protein